MKIDVIYDISLLGEGYDGIVDKTGIYRVTEELLRELIKHHEVQIYLFASQKNYYSCQKYIASMTDLNNRFISLIPEIRFKDLQDRINNIIAYLSVKIKSNYKYELFFKILRKIVKLILIVLSTSISHSRQIENILSENRFIYHSVFYNFPAIIKTNKQVKKIITIHDLIPLLFPSLFKADLREHFIKRLIDDLNPEVFVHSVSKSTRNDLINYRSDLNPDKIFVSYLGASDAFYECKDAGKIKHVKSIIGLQENSQYFLCLATIEPRKNLKTIVKAYLAMIEKADQDYLYLVIAGAKGWKYDDFFSEIGILQNLKKKIIITEFIDDSLLAPLYSGALAFIFMSYYEGFGLPVLEAMKCGLPVIVSNRSSLPEVVGDAGIMIDPDDVNALTDAIFQVYSNKSLRKKMSDNSFERSKLFSWRRCVDDIVSGYKKVLKINGINSDSK